MTQGTFDEMINTYKQGVYNFTDNGKCIECGSCCSRYLAMTNKEINTIRKYIEKNKIEQQKHSLNVLAGRYFDATCPFLDDTKPNHKCSIYPVRPEICREFKCDCWQQEITHKSKLFNGNYRAVDVTELFFGNK